jgi:phosphonate transport system ATP-binding protein
MPAAATSQEWAFDARAVCKSFGGRMALDGVDLQVAPGEMVALIGPSGSGKSTLLRTLTGLVCIDAGPGRIQVLGRPVQAQGRLSSDVRQVRKDVGFIFQQFNLLPRLSLFSNAMIGALPRVGRVAGLLGRWPRAEAERGMAALARVGVADYAGQRAGTLSGGQQQRGAIARTLVQGARAVLADEPVASLDPVSSRRVMSLLKALCEEDGLTVVVTLHSVAYAQRYCRRTVALKAGRIAYDGPSAGLTRELLADVYGPEYLADEGEVGPVVSAAPAGASP